MGSYANFINDPYLYEFTIELEKKDACFAPGESMIGRVVLRAKQSIEADSLKIHFYGSAKLKSKMKSGENSAIYLNHQLDASTKCQSIEADNTVFVQFEEKLSSTLLTSIESKNSSVLYTIRAQMAYKTEENELKIINAVKGFTIVETFDLNVLPFRYFEPPNHNLVKKFGLFSCTGGQIKLHFTICRSAFVCGENISIEGRIENKTDRRVDKVAAVLQQVIIISGGDGDDKDLSETSILDVSDIHEDNLALFVDEGQAIKIERNFPIPALPPSTMINDLNDESRSFSGLNSKKRMSISTGRLSFSSVNHKFPVIVPPGARFFKILYQLSIKVKTGGVEVMEINVPIIIGSIPYNLSLPKTLNQMKEKDKSAVNTPLPPEEKVVIYRQSRKDRPILLAVDDEYYICSKAQLNFVNKYPFYADLPTSSKQSRKINVLANTIQAESKLIHGIRRQDGMDNSSYSSEHTIQLPNSLSMEY